MLCLAHLWACCCLQLELLAAPWDPALEDGGMGDFGEATNWADMSRKKTSSRDISHFKSFKDGGVPRAASACWLLPRVRWMLSFWF